LGTEKDSKENDGAITIMEWIMNVNVDARVAYYLLLTEKVMDQLDNEEGYLQARKTIDMCWDWVKDKKYSGDDLYLMLDNEDDGGVSIYEQFTDDPQQVAIWFCVIYAIAYTIWQAYKHENQKYVPQPIEIVDDDTIDEFMINIRKIHGYSESWADILKQYLLDYYSLVSSNKKIHRSEIMNKI
jgi:hypothetical protein